MKELQASLEEKIRTQDNKSTLSQPSAANDGLSFAMPVKAAAKIRENFDTNTTIDQVKRQEKTLQEIEESISEIKKQ